LTKQYDKSFSLLLPLQNIAKNRTSLRAKLNIGLGNSYLGKGDTEKAEIAFCDAQKFGNEIRSEPLIIDALYGLGRCNEISRRTDGAIYNYNESLRMLDKSESKINSDLEKATFLQKHYRLSQSLIDLYYDLFISKKLGIFERETYYSIEKVKANSFLSYLTKSRINLDIEKYEKEIDDLRKMRNNYFRILSSDSKNRKEVSQIETEVQKVDDLQYRVISDKLKGNLKDNMQVDLHNFLSLPPILYTTRPPEGNRKVCTASFPTEHRTSTCSQISGP
jgi:tetratricopeptide (TPR) repeat protein